MPMMKPYALFQRDPSIPSVAYATLGAALAAGAYRYRGRFQVRSETEAEAVRGIPRIPGAVWIDEVDGEVRRIATELTGFDENDVEYEGRLLDLLGYPGIIDHENEPEHIQVKFRVGPTWPDFEAAAAAERQARGMGEMDAHQRLRIRSGEAMVTVRANLVRTMIGFVGLVNDRRRADPGTTLSVTEQLVSMKRIAIR